MATILLQSIGILRSDIITCEEAPKKFDESERTGTIEISQQYSEGLEGIGAGQTMIVLCWLHQASRDTLKVHPRADRTRKQRGVFSTRSPGRPNPIAISEFKVVSKRDTFLEVSGVDILDGTPVIDIKKVLSR